MDYSLLISQIFILWWLIPILLVITFFKSPWFKGVMGEWMVKTAAQLQLPADIYCPIHNVTLPIAGGTTQIDHVFVSRYGVFVLETKNMKGWIFGSEHQSQWTQKIFKKSIRFQNPLRQNYKHVKALIAAADLPENIAHSIIVFTGESTFKTPMPANVVKGNGYISYIKSFQDVVLTEVEVQRVLSLIQSGRLQPTRETHRQHVQSLKKRLGSTSPAVTCPRCGSHMVVRTAKKGANAGNKFLGCSTFPRCRAVKNIN